MDRNTIIGIALMIGILITFNILTKPSEEELEKQRKELQMQDSLARLNQVDTTLSIDTNVQQVADKFAQVPDSILTGLDSVAKDSVATAYLVKKDSEMKAQQLDLFYPAGQGENQFFNLENDKVILTISSKSGRVVSAKLKEYQNYDNYMLARDKAGENGPIEIMEPLELFGQDSSAQYLQFYLLNQKQIKTNDLYFDLVSQTKDKLVLRAKTSDPEKYIEYTYVLTQGKYDVSYNIAFVGLQNDVDGTGMRLKWGHLSNSTEKLTLGQSTNQSRMSSVFFKPKNQGREFLTEMMPDARTLNSKTEWVAFKQGYFSSAVMWDKGFNKSSFVGSKPIKTANYADVFVANLDISETINPNTNIGLSFFFGPNDYETLAVYNNDMEDIIDLGWGVFRYVNKFLIMPIFNFFNGFGWNLGIIILLVTIIVRLIILPLTYKNYQSSARMKVLKPEIAEIQAKYKNGDAVKKQQETMALYRKTGVNPMAGCLPLFIQMPILIAVFRFFPSSLELRQHSFLWAEDLSTYESIYDLPFSIPAYGSHVSLFTLLLCISTIFYTRMNSNQMSMPQQEGMPNMKIIMYMMPIMMLFFLNSYSSGLTFYYFCGNLLTMGLMLLVKKYMIDEKKIRAKIEENKRKPRDKSNFQKRMDEMMKQQQAKQKAKKK